MKGLKKVSIPKPKLPKGGKAAKPIGAGKHKLGSKLSTAEILKGALK